MLVPNAGFQVTQKVIRMSVSNKLQHLIDDQDITQTQLAEGTGLSRHTIDGLIRQKREMKVYELYVISRYFKVDLEYFLPWEAFGDCTL